MANLSKAQRRPRGQVATLLLLVMVGVLIMAIMTANFGQMSTAALQVSNAADAASLNLGSQLATKAHQLYKAIPGLQRCKKGFGWFSFIFPILLAVLAIVNPAVAGFFGGKIAAATALGAIGGATAGVIATGDLRGAAIGALQGAMIGASLAYGVDAFGKAFGAGAKAGAGMKAGAGGARIGGILEGTGLQGIKEFGAGQAIQGISGTVLSGSVVAAPTAFAAAAGGLLSAGSGYLSFSQTANQLLNEAAIASAANQLNGLPTESLRIQQSVIHDALLRTVDDPNRTGPEGTCYEAVAPTNPTDPIQIRPINPAVSGDPNDSDGDGNTTESIPCFQHWWERRVDELKRSSSQANIPQAVTNFLNGPLATFNAQAATTYSPGGFLARREIEGGGGTWRQRVQGTNDGPVVALVRLLESPADRTFTILNQQSWQSFQLTSENQAAYPLQLWGPGPPAEAFNTWFDQEDCAEECSPPPGEWDEVDAVNEDMRDFVETVSQVQELQAQPANTWQAWAFWFYDRNSDDHYHKTLGDLVNGESGGQFRGLKDWQQQLQNVRDELPECTCAVIPPWAQGVGFGGQNWITVPCDQPNSFGGMGEAFATNPPCKVGSGVATSDPDISTDEFAEARQGIDGLIGQIEAFRSAARAFVEGLVPTVAGSNPRLYGWKDSRGDHWVRVFISPFRIPRLVNTRSGGFFRKTVCVRLADYSSGTTPPSVEITRWDSTGDMGFWRWNASSHGDGRTIRKRSRAFYRYDRVGVARVN